MPTLPPADRSLFERVVEQTGLSPLLGPGVVRRALAEAGVDAATARPEHYLAILETLRTRLCAYLAEDEANSRCRKIKQTIGALDDDRRRR